jgi:hypothetical protein
MKRIKKKLVSESESEDGYLVLKTPDFAKN